MYRVLIVEDYLRIAEAIADDFIAKPFDMDVPVAKIQALLRRTYDFAASVPILEHRGAFLNTGGHVSDLLQCLLQYCQRSEGGVMTYCICLQLNFWVIIRKKGRFLFVFFLLHNMFYKKLDKLLHFM